MAGQSNNFSETSVSGGFNLQGNQFNGDVNIGGPFHNDTDDSCLRLLKIVSPEDEKTRILAVKDELLKASYSWILEDETFRSWRNGDTNHLLWIKGGPGKGKTMIMAGLVNILSEEARNSEGAVALSYFFCQNSESELRNVTSIVKGLIYMLALRERSLRRHLRKKYEAGGEEVFTGPRALYTLWNVLEDMLRDLHGATVYLLVDGLDECDDPEFDNFLRLLSQCNLTTPGKVKWLVTSRPLQRIEDIIRPDQNRSRITLEIEAQHVSQGVEAFIGEKVNLLKLKKKWTEETTQIVHSYLQRNAEGTFLWVVLVCQRLQRFPSWKVQDELTKLTSLQRGLDSFYERMMQVVRDEIPEYADLCMKILRTTTLAYRPLRLRELGTVVTLPHELQSDDSPNFDALRDLIERCGSFILVHEDTIYFVHQSAKDYLLGESGSTNFPLDRLREHTSIAERCLDTLNSCLKDNQFPDPTSLNKKELSEDELQLLSRIAYACSYWIQHAFESVAQASLKDCVPNQDKICELLEFRLIAWVHSLGSLKEVTSCVGMIKAFLDIQGFESTNLFHMMQETYRFLRQSRQIIEESPNQAYTSALLFLPRSSWIRENYQNHIPKWIKLTTQLNETWDACLETLLGHTTEVRSLTFSSDGSLLASKSEDCTWLWETETGRCCGTISYDPSAYDDSFLAFSPDDRVLISQSGNGFEILDIATGSQLHLPVDTCSRIRFNSQIVAIFEGGCLGLWNMFTGEKCGVFEPHGKCIADWAFSNDGKRIAVEDEGNIKIRDLETSKIVTTFREHHNSIKSVQFSPDSRLVLSVCSESIWLWPQAMAKPGKKLESHLDEVESAKFSPDGSLVLSAHKSGAIVILWETSTGNKLHVITPKPTIIMDEAMISPDSKTLVNAYLRGAVIWDTTTGKEIARLEVSEPAEYDPYFTKCSKEGTIVAQVETSGLRIWEVATGDLLHDFGDNSGGISAIEFSPAGGLVASASQDGAVQLWTLKNTTSNQPTFRGDMAVEGLTLSSDGTLAAFISDSKGLCLWDLESESPRILLRPGEYDLGSGIHTHYLVISPDKNLLACRTFDEVWVRDTEKGSLRYKNKVRNCDVHRMSFSPDGTLLRIKYRQDISIRLLENHTWGFEDVLKPPHAESTQSQLSPDGRFIVKQEGSLRTACLWKRDGESDQETFKFELGGAGGVATFSPDSKFIAFVSSENFISVWEVETGACHDVSSNLICSTGVGSFSQDNRSFAYIRSQGLSWPRANHGPTKVGLFAEALAPDALSLLKLCLGIPRAQPFVFEDPVKLVTFSPDARMVAAVSGSAIVLWKTPPRPPAEKLEYDQKRVSDITFLPDRNILIAGYEDGTIGSWDTNNYALLHTLRTEDRPPRFSLDSKRKFLWTGNRGFFFDEFLQPDKEPAISLERDWVMFNGERVFCLPPEFMPFPDWVASDKHLVMGHQPGDLTIVRFDF